LDLVDTLTPLSHNTQQLNLLLPTTTSLSSSTMRCSPPVVFLVLASSATTEAFAFSRTPSVHRSSPIILAAAKDDRPFAPIRNFVAISSITFGLLSPTSDVLAAQDTIYRPTSLDNAMSSSTVTLSDVIRTMDFSLPSGSYDSIAAPVASGTDELTKSEDPRANAKKAVKKAAPAKKASSGGANRGVSIAMPSFGGGGGSAPAVSSDAYKPLTAEEKKAVLAQRRAEREAAAAQEKADTAAAEKQARAEVDARIAAARLERIAKREEEAAQKAAEENAKREEAFKNVKVVDTSMPVY
jgi:hypothetical protein